MQSREELTAAQDESGLACSISVIRWSQVMTVLSRNMISSDASGCCSTKSSTAGTGSALRPFPTLSREYAAVHPTFSVPVTLSS